MSLQYIYFRQNAFTETGDDGAALAVDARDANSLRSRVGSTLRREYHWGNATVIPQLTGGWAHEYLDDDPLEAQFVGGVTPFSIDRGGVFRDAGFFDASLTVQRGQRASVFCATTASIPAAAISVPSTPDWRFGSDRRRSPRARCASLA